MINQSWQERIGNQRDWVWRGWQTRFSYIRAANRNYENIPLIFIHGFGASIEHWRQNLPVISQQYTVYAIDLLGFGASRKADTKYSVGVWTEQIHDFWQAFVGEPVIIVGNSIGSLISLAAAATHPAAFAVAAAGRTPPTRPSLAPPHRRKPWRFATPMPTKCGNPPPAYAPAAVFSSTTSSSLTIPGSA